MHTTGEQAVRPQRPRPPRAPRPELLAAAPLGAASLLALQLSAGNRAAALVVSRERKPKAAAKRAPRKPRVTYLTESLVGEQERVTRVRSRIAPTSTKGRGAAPPPLSQVSGGLAGQKEGFDGGHVIGLLLGGPNVSKNVVPMYRAFNRGAYQNAENELAARAARALLSGLQPGLTVICHYPDAAADVPDRFELEYWVGTAASVTETISLSQPGDIRPIPAMSAEHAELVGGGGDLAALRAKAAAVLGDPTAFELGNAASVADVIGRTGHLPPSTRGWYPDSHEDRPYEYLDILALAGSLEPMPSFGPRYGFSPDQRRFIKQTNMLRNGGVMKSDDTNDPVHHDPQFNGVLSESGAVNYPEVDHIVPNSSGGSNFYSNARLVSWQLNNREARVKPTHHLVDVRRQRLPALAGTNKQKAQTLVLQFVHRTRPADPFRPAHVGKWARTTFSALGPEMTPRLQLAIKHALVALAKEGVVTQQGKAFVLVQQ